MNSQPWRKQREATSPYFSRSHDNLQVITKRILCGTMNGALHFLKIATFLTKYVPGDCTQVLFIAGDNA